jgi:tetratricopeptide (TPR) repeat protein
MKERPKALRIFISSPGDVVEERTLTRRVLERLAGEFSGRVTLEPIFWEHEPLLATDTFQKQIVRPSETDILVSILWSRLGTRLPAQFTRADGSRYDSGTEYEFEDAVAAYKREGHPDLLVYRKTADPVVSLKDKKALLEKLSQKEALDAFFSKWFQDEAEGTLIAAFHPFERSSDFEELLESHLKKLIERRLPEEEPGAEVRTAPVQWREGSPFRGLHVFNFEHAPIFFGRTKAVGDVLNALRVQASEGCAFVLVLGMSGGGKSSLAQAGVLPVLTQPGVIEGVGLWRHAIMRPGDSSGDVFDALAASILEKGALPELAADNIDAAELAQLLRETPKAVLPLLKTGLSQAASERAKARETAERPSARLALVVDQLEELFTLERVTAEERARFVEALDLLARSGWVWVIATMRSDFYPRCAELEKLVALKEGAGQYDLLPPTPAEIGQMIRQPALAAGLHFEEDPVTKERLDEVLRDAAAKDPSSLALLEFTLEELYKKRTERGLLTHEAYRGLGGVEGALAQRGEEVYEGLEKDVQSALGPVFRELVGIGQGADETITRKYAPYDVVTSTPGARKFLETFVEARLFITDLDAKGNAVVSVAHEALLKHWPRLQEWVEKNKENLRSRARVSAAASRWTEEGKTRDFLLAAGKPLAEAEELVKDPTLELSDQERTFIKASVAKKRRLWWMKRAVVAALAVLTLVAAGAAYLANKQRERAQIEAKTSSQVSNFLVSLFKVSDPSEAKGNSITAREVLDKGVDQVQKELKDQPEIQATLMLTMGNVYMNLGLYEQSSPLLEKTIELREELFGRYHPAVATSLFNLSLLKETKAEYGQALSMGLRALEIWEKSHGPEHSLTAGAAANIGTIYWKMGKFDEAESFLVRALEVRKKVLGAESREVASNFNNLANIAHDRGQYDKAETYYKNALAIWEKSPDQDALNISHCLSNLALLYYSQRETAEVESLYQRSLAIREKFLGAEHPDVADVLHNLALFYRSQGRFPQAESLFRRSLAIREKALGSGHPNVAQSLDQLAVLYCMQGQFRESLPFFERALAINEKSLGPEHPELAMSLNNLAATYGNLKMHDKTESNFKRALAIREKALGPDHPLVASSLLNLGRAYYSLKKFEEAEPLVQRGLDILEKKFGPEHSTVADALHAQANLYADWRKYDRAEPLYQRALAIGEKVWSQKDRRLAELMMNFALMLRQTGRLEEANQLRARAKVISGK